MGISLKKLPNLNYLGTSITYDNDLSVEINNRINNKCKQKLLWIKEAIKITSLGAQAMTTRQKSYIHCTCF
jgi:hypothetical protein